ncbi:MAG: hypothetical protein O3A46_07135 [Candidatus Poribacteria bacterium]|nr:hypothetical protein [Candidatus Poribacteria bacterium]
MSLKRALIRAAILTVGIVAFTAISLRPIEFGTWLELVVLGWAVAALFVGMSRACDAVAIGFSPTRRTDGLSILPTTTCLVTLTSMIATMTVGTTVAAIITKASPLGVLKANFVIGGMMLAAYGTGLLCARWLRHARLGVAAGMLTWAPILTAFIWLPSLVPTSGKWLGFAVNINPLFGVVSALDKRQIFWLRVFYGKLPYAEYAVKMIGVWTHAAIWYTVGLSLIGLCRLRWRRS